MRLTLPVLTFTPALLRNGMLVLCVLSLCNMGEALYIAHRIGVHRQEDNERRVRIDHALAAAQRDLQNTSLIVQRLCDTVHADCARPDTGEAFANSR